MSDTDQSGPRKRGGAPAAPEGDKTRVTEADVQQDRRRSSSSSGASDAAPATSGDGPADTADAATRSRLPSNGVLLAITAAAVAILLAYVWKDARLQQTIRDLELRSPMHSLESLWHAFDAHGNSSVYDRKPDRPGRVMAARGATVKYPIILIPGFVTSGLELWHGHECAEGLFRSRLWTRINMASSFFSDKQCWVKHLLLNYTTGLDPNGIRVRNAQGLDAIDYFMPGYAVWAKTIEALADIGYDSTTLVAMPYDWRLSIPNLQLRDAYFTRLKDQVEQFNHIYHEKVLIAAHSWGDNVARAFLHWMEDRQPGWVDEHVAVHFNIAGPTLGVPKSATALLSGEMRETSQLTGMAYLLGEQLLCKEDRTLLWRTWGSAIGMLPIGGSAIWGNETWAPDDTPEIRAANRTFGPLITALIEEEANSTESALSWVRGSADSRTNKPAEWRLPAEAVVAEIIKDAGPTFLRHVRNWSGAKLPDDERDITEGFCPRHCNGNDTLPAEATIDLDAADPTTDWWPEQLVAWAQTAFGDGAPVFPRTTEGRHFRAPNPLDKPLPNAPNLRIYCGYGYGLASERAFHYRHFRAVETGDAAEADVAAIKNTEIAQSQISAGASWEVNRHAHNTTQELEKGVQYGDGDGTVPITSLGALCLGGWRHSSLNPHGVKVVTREYLSKQTSIMSGGDLRGGPEMAAHVEILGNKHFLQDLLRAAAGWHHELDDAIGSNIRTIVDNIPLWK